MAGFGACVAGKVESGRTVVRAPFLEWRGVPLADLLEAATNLPTTVENDVTALTTAEQWFGPARHAGCSTAILSAPGLVAQVTRALGRVVTYDEVLLLAAAGRPEVVAVTEAAGRALGRLLGYVANLALVDTIVLSGEGVGLWSVAGQAARAQLDADRDPEATPVTLHVDDSGFVA